MKKILLLIFICLISISFTACQKSEVDEIKSFVENEMDEIIDTIEVDPKGFYFDEDELKNIEVGQPMVCYDLVDYDKGIENNLKEDKFYVVPLMYNKEPRLDATITYIDKKDKWEIIDIGGQICVKVKYIEDKYKLKDIKIVQGNQRVLVATNSDGNLVGYLPYSNEDKLLDIDILNQKLKESIGGILVDYVEDDEVSYLIKQDNTKTNTVEDDNYQKLLIEEDVNNFLGNYNLLINYLDTEIKSKKYDEVKSLVDKTEEKLIDLKNQEKIDDLIVYNYYVKLKSSLYDSGYLKDSIGYLQKCIELKETDDDFKMLVIYNMELYKQEDNLENKKEINKNIQEIVNLRKEYFKEKEVLIKTLNKVLEEKIVL